MKKLICIAAALAMVLCFGAVSYAEETDVAMIGEERYTSLAAALSAAAEMSGDVTITLIGDVIWETGAGHGSTPLIPENSSVGKVTIDGQNLYKFTATGKGVGPIRAANGSLLAFENLTIVDLSESYAETSWELGYLEMGGNLSFSNVVFNDGVIFEGDSVVAANNCVFTGKNPKDEGGANIKMYGAWVYNGSGSFTNCRFEGIRGLKVHQDYGSELGDIEVINCTFDFTNGQKPGIAIGDMPTNGTLLVKDCTMYGVTAGDQNIYAYESDTDVSTFNLVIENTFAYDANGIQRYPEIEDLSANVEIAKPITETSVNESIPEEVKEEASSVAEATEISIEEYAKSITEDDAAEMLKDAETLLENPTTIIIESEVIVSVEEYVPATEESAAYFALDIEPVINFYVADENGNKELFKTENADDKIIVVTIQLPEGFAEEGETVYVLHTKDNGKQYEYEGTVENGAISFSTDKGFSRFEVSTEKTLVTATPEKEPVRDTVTIVVGEGEDETSEDEIAEQNPNTGAPVFSVAPVLAAAVLLFKRK